jgi:hypothetical protein
MQILMKIKILYVFILTSNKDYYLYSFYDLSFQIYDFIILNKMWFEIVKLKL